jgi:hypothetical protein
MESESRQCLSGSINHFLKCLENGILSQQGCKLYGPVSDKGSVKRSPYFYTRELNKTVVEIPPDSLTISMTKGLFKLKGPIEVHYTKGVAQKELVIGC